MFVGFLVLGLYGIFLFLLMVGMMILSGLGPYRMARHAGIPRPWMAFIPVANLYLIGLLAERSYYVYKGRGKKLSRRSVIFALIPLAASLVLYAALLFSIFYHRIDALYAPVILLFPLWILSFIPALVNYVCCLYYLFRDYAPDNAVLYTIISILFRIAFVFLLVERDTVPVSVTGFGAYPGGRPKYDRWHQWSQMPPQQYPPGAYPPRGGGPGTTGPEDYYRNS